LPQDAVAHPLMKIRWLLCASPHYLAKYGAPQQLEELSAHRYLRFTRAQPDQRLHARIGGKLQEVTLKPVLTSNDDEFLLRAVRAARGLCVFPDYLVNELVGNGTLQVVLPKADIESAFGSTAYVLFSQHRALPARIRAFLEHLRGTRFERPIA
jgi:DNA-binding transcriptional LysR family regulator